MATPAPPHFMKGGVRVFVGDLFSKYETPVAVITLLFMSVVIVFLNKVPAEIRNQADSLPGRALLLVFTVIVTTLFGWPLGMLAALMSALLIGAGGIKPKVVKQVEEGFSPDLNVRLIPNKHKWYVEKVLGENPLLIEDQTIGTSAVQDLSEKNSGSVQSNNVTM